MGRKGSNPVSDPHGFYFSSSYMKNTTMLRLLTVLFGLTVALSAGAQKRKIQNKPFIDTRR